jgi:hypothetical protein
VSETTTGPGATRPGGKGRPTPKRSEAREAYLRERKGLGPARGSGTLTGRAGRKQARQERVVAQRQMRADMRSADVSKLPPREQVPQRIIARDVVDARKVTIGSLLLPIMVIFFAAFFLRSPGLSSLLGLISYILIFGLIIDTTVISRKVRRLTRERAPGTPISGHAFYIFQRSIQPRKLRMPAPRVGRGEPLPLLPGERRH